MRKYYFFDLDNTLTRSKADITPEYAAILQQLADTAEVIVVSGTKEDEILSRLSPLSGKIHILGQNGNRAVHKSGDLLWERLLSDEQKSAILSFIAKARAHKPLPVKDHTDLIDDRGCQIAFSLIGHHENIDVKEKFDPDHSIRLSLLADLQEEVRKLEDMGIEVKSGGTTVLDIFQKGKHKGYNVRTLIEQLGWDPQHALYIGDALFPGGNDATVIGIIDTHPVPNFHATYEFLKKELGIA